MYTSDNKAFSLLSFQIKSVFLLVFYTAISRGVSPAVPSVTCRDVVTVAF